MVVETSYYHAELFLHASEVSLLRAANQPQAQAPTSWVPTQLHHQVPHLL